MKTRKKMPIDLLVMIISTLFVCTGGALATMGVFDGSLFPLNWDLVGATLLTGVWGFFMVLVLTLPVWFLYGYVRVAVNFYQQGRKKAFVLWLVLAAALAVVIIGLIVFAVLLSHHVVY